MEARVLELEREPDPDLDPDAFYHAHEEDNVPATAVHDAIVDYLRDALSVLHPDRWVAADICCYWIPRNSQVYLGPDLIVAERPTPEKLPSSYRKWEHGPLLLVVEIGSRSSFRRDVGPKLERYAEGLQPREYLYYDADRRILSLHRRSAGGYEEVPPDEDGRVWSAALGAGFEIREDGLLRASDVEGRPLLSHLETERSRREAERRAEEAERRERELAERLAALEAELARRGERP